MVSTRGIRYKFSEGERVLCYEPDPTKAKVLYDSKVLEVIESKDKRGRRTVEYLIHFQGWNSSWDRCVSEDFVLKDTEENRQLQHDLAEKSQLQLGAYLYRRERKKTSNSNAGTGPAKRPRHGFSDDGSSSSTQPDEGEMGDTDSSSGSGSQPRSPPHALLGRALIALPSALRDRLTFDYHLVVKRGRVSQLPASPSAAQILESFVKWFARAGAWHPPRARNEPPARPDLLDVSCRLNLVREVADGLRVYFDFILPGHLLYKQEMQQYYDICGKYVESEDIKSEDEAYEEDESKSQEEIRKSVEVDLKSPKIPEYSHLPPDPMPDNDNTQNAPVIDEVSKSESNEKVSIKNEPVHEGTSTNCVNNKPAPKPAGLARRLRSHKSSVSQPEVEEPANPAHPAAPALSAPSTSTAEPRTFDTQCSSVGSSGSRSSLSEWSAPAPPAPPAAAPAPASALPPGAPAPHTRTPLSLLLDKVAKWQIIPREGTENLPCRVYGAIHLARLFVKLPDFLNATQMPDYKLKLILKHIDMFVQYLDDHSEWFGEMYYIADATSRSH